MRHTRWLRGMTVARASGTLVAVGVVALGAAALARSFRDETKRMFPEFRGAIEDAIALIVEHTAEFLAERRRLRAGIRPRRPSAGGAAGEAVPEASIIRAARSGVVRWSLMA